MSRPIFVADPPGDGIMVRLESLVAIYHARSGATHLLASPAPEILDALAEGPADARTVLARLGRDHDVGGTDAFAAIEARLGELEASGLVWRL